MENLTQQYGGIRCELKLEIIDISLGLAIRGQIKIF
jgi:hypothetical protein